MANGAEERYYANGFNFKIVQGTDGWWGIYRWHVYAGKYIPLLQAKTLEKAKDWCDLCEPVTIPLKRLC